MTINWFQIANGGTLISLWERVICFVVIMNTVACHVPLSFKASENNMLHNSINIIFNYMFN